jgi:hypothetical protein
LRDLVPDADVIALLVNPNTQVGQVQTKDVQEVARRLEKASLFSMAEAMRVSMLASLRLPSSTSLRLWSGLIHFSIQDGTG